MDVIIITALLGCGIWLVYGDRRLIQLGLSSYKWDTTEGTIIDSQDNSFTVAGVVGRAGTGIETVKYEETAHSYVYVVGGRTYYASTYCFGGWADNAGAAYLIGTKVPVYFDPQHPEIAVLKRGLQMGALFGFAPILAAVGWTVFKCIPWSQ